MPFNYIINTLSGTQTQVNNVNKYEINNAQRKHMACIYNIKPIKREPKLNHKLSNDIRVHEMAGFGIIIGIGTINSAMKLIKN